VGQCERGSASGAKEEGPRKGFSEPERLCEGQIRGRGRGTCGARMRPWGCGRQLTLKFVYENKLALSETSYAQLVDFCTIVQVRIDLSHKSISTRIFTHIFPI
jgi:hypothetical protein